MPTMEQFLRENGYLVRPIVGCSMLPMLEADKDTVHLVPVTRELSAGDLPMYRRPDGVYVLHRILAVKKTHYLIRGDNCAFFEKVPKSWVIAVADGFSKDGRYVSVQDEEYLAYVDGVLKGDGTYTGTLKRRIEDKGRGTLLLSLLFPSAAAMRERYPVLRTCIVLLPFMYLYRLLACPFSRNTRHAFACACKALFRK